MLQINNLHPTAGDKPIPKVLSLAMVAALLTGCGNLTETKEAAREAAGTVANEAIAKLDYDQVLGQLPPEARAIVTAYVGDLQTAAAAHVAEFGQLPANIGELTSVAGARAAAVNLIADGLGEQIPFASRETLEKTAASLLGTAETQVLDRMRTQDAPNK
ncbi:MAG: hypothetical protein HC788_11325 [Sphingopyxis sp.]|nr:hypothetical protein [Sphingopyxis sp.]